MSSTCHEAYAQTRRKQVATLLGIALFLFVATLTGYAIGHKNRILHPPTIAAATGSKVDEGIKLEWDCTAKYPEQIESVEDRYWVRQTIANTFFKRHCILKIYKSGSVASRRCFAAIDNNNKMILLIPTTNFQLYFNKLAASENIVIDKPGKALEYAKLYIKLTHCEISGVFFPRSSKDMQAIFAKYRQSMGEKSYRIFDTSMKGITITAPGVVESPAGYKVRICSWSHYGGPLTSWNLTIHRNGKVEGKGTWIKYRWGPYWSEM